MKSLNYDCLKSLNFLATDGVPENSKLRTLGTSELLWVDGSGLRLASNGVGDVVSTEAPCMWSTSSLCDPVAEYLGKGTVP